MLIDTETPTKKRTFSTSSSGDYKDILAQMKATSSHRINVTKGSSSSTSTPNEAEERTYSLLFSLFLVSCVKR
jgi:hypothetical protein